MKRWLSPGKSRRAIRTNKSTVSQKAKVIRDMFKIEYFDEDLSTEHMLEKSPYRELTMLGDLIITFAKLF